jgi:hypothetical protein
MHDDNLNPSERPVLEELQGPVRAAVVHIREEVMPQESVERSMDRAAQLNKAARKRRSIRGVLAAAALAAALLAPVLLAAFIKEEGQSRVLFVADASRSLDGAWDYRTHTFGLPGDGTSNTVKGSSRVHVRGRNAWGDIDEDGQVDGRQLAGEKAGEAASSTPESRAHPVPHPDVPLPNAVNAANPVGTSPMPIGVTRPRTYTVTSGRAMSPDGKSAATGNAAGIWNGASQTSASFLDEFVEQDNIYWNDKSPAGGQQNFRVRGGAELKDRKTDVYKDIWGHLPEEDRKKAINELTHRLETTIKSQLATRGDTGKELKDLAESWLMIPEAERAKAAKKVLDGVPPAERNAKLLEVEELTKKLKKLESNKQPQVWKQRSGRPTFARVYVGDGNALDLVSLQVTTTVEGPRARTVVDHVFFNPHQQQLEGTFEYPLPTGASPSYYAMFPGKSRDAVPALFARRGQAPPLAKEALASMTPAVMARAVSSDDWGNLMESRVVNQQRALEVYEEVTRRRIDPALLEYAGGNTFSGRVFPIPAKGYTRVILAYEELLPVIGDKCAYRFALPDCPLSEVVFTLQASAAECKDAAFAPNDAWKKEGEGRLGYHRTWTGHGPGGSVVFTFRPPQSGLQVVSGRQNESGPLYVYARIRPELAIQEAKPFAENAVFLLDTSLSEHPDRFGVSMKLLKKILESDAAIKQFNILAFNVGSAWVEPKGWLPNTKAGRDTAFARLDGIVLEGATDLGSALEKLAATPFLVSRSRDPFNTFLLSDGQITWGESDANALVSRFESLCPAPTRFHCYRTGLGADNLELFTALTRRGGGVFNCFTEADLAAVAMAHRSQCFQVEQVRFVDGPAVSDVLIAGRKAAVYPGGELIVSGRAAATGKTRLVVEGSYLGKKLVKEYPIEITAAGELAPRGWGEVAVASLLSINDPKYDGLVTAYCQQFNIGSRVASFLILENENEYKRFNLEEERGKTVNNDLGKFLEETWKNLAKTLSPKQALERFLARIEPRVNLMGGAQGDHVKKLLALLGDGDCELPTAAIKGAVLRKSDVAPEYLAERDKDSRNVACYLTEARRRAGKQDVDGAVRVLSSVIEQYPTRGDALRLVGYRLLDMKQPVHAARLFQQVERSRPFEPHSYRDLARSLEECGKYGLAAMQYEIVLAGTWHNRFRESLKQVVLEEYARMMREAIQRRAVTGKLADHFGERLEKMDPSQAQSDLRVTISWNTDATDVDLWVIEPDGEKCFYSHKKTKSGGELSQDQTQGYGPERYQTKQAQKGTYRVAVHYYSVNPNLLAGETHVNVTVTRFAGTPQEVTERHTVILKKHGEEVEVCRVEF